MLNRRLIRIKAFKVLYSSVCSGNRSLEEVQRELLASCEETRRLYLFLLQLGVALKQAADQRIELGLKKFHPTEEERNPNRKFSANRVSEALFRHEDLSRTCANQQLLWDEEEPAAFVRRLYAAVASRDYFREYMNSPEHSLQEDCELFLRIYREELEDNEELGQLLEDRSLYWTDDLGYVLNVILRTLAILRDKGTLQLAPLFIKEDDRIFARELTAFSCLHYREYLDLVKENIPNWDLDRLVVTDITLIIMGIAEAVRFDSIPVKVTINEYVEISKYYSTPNSKVFVNGLLDRLIRELQLRGTVVKRGAGLIEN